MLWLVCVCVCILATQSCPTLCDPMDCSHQAPLSMGFSRQENWSGLPFPSPVLWLKHFENTWRCEAGKTFMNAWISEVCPHGLERQGYWKWKDEKRDRWALQVGTLETQARDLKVGWPTVPVFWDWRVPGMGLSGLKLEIFLTCLMNWPP